jgi:hypothetical protein
MSRTGFGFKQGQKPIENQRFYKKNNKTPVSIKPDVLLWWGMVDSKRRKRHFVRECPHSLPVLRTGTARG